MGKLLCWIASMPRDFRFQQPDISSPSFSPDEKYLIWSDKVKKGIESLDLMVLRQQLAEVGLDWERQKQNRA